MRLSQKYLITYGHIILLRMALHHVVLNIRIIYYCQLLIDVKYEAAARDGITWRGDTLVTTKLCVHRNRSSVRDHVASPERASHERASHEREHGGAVRRMFRLRAMHSILVRPITGLPTI